MYRNDILNKLITMKKQEEINTRLQAIYERYLAKMHQLKKKQTEIIGTFLRRLEQRKIDTIRRKVESSTS